MTQQQPQEPQEVQEHLDAFKAAEDWWRQLEAIMKPKKEAQP